MHGDANFVRVAFFDRRVHDRPERFDRMILIDNVPNLHQIGLLLCKFAHELARLLGRIDPDDGRIAEIELLAGYTRDERSGDRNSRRFRLRSFYSAIYIKSESAV